MVWIVIVFICIALLFLLIRMISSRRSGKSVSRQTTPVETFKRSNKDIGGNKVSFREKKSRERDKRQRVSKAATQYGYSGETTRTHARHDLESLFEESIRTPFPDEWSPALPYLHEAHRLQEKGADQEKIEEVLKKARDADRDATANYLIRMSIIQKVRRKRWQNRQRPK